MTSSASRPLPPSRGGRAVAPPAEPRAIRACLGDAMAAEFDAEWSAALEEAKHSHDLSEVHRLLVRWRHLAHYELNDPGDYFRVRATATRTLVEGHAPPGAASGDEVRASMRERLGPR